MNHISAYIASDSEEEKKDYVDSESDFEEDLQPLNHLEIEEKKDEDQLPYEDTGNEALPTTWQEIEVLPFIRDHPLIPATTSLNVMTPIELFDRTIGLKLLDLLTFHTNEYAAQKLNEEETSAHLERNPESRMHHWKKTTPEEISQYLAILLSMALGKKGTIKEYWDSTPCFQSYLSRIMSLKRFELLDHFLQINSRKPNQWKCMEKVEPLLKLFEEFNQIYTFSTKIALDEIIAPFSGRENI